MDLLLFWFLFWQQAIFMELALFLIMISSSTKIQVFQNFDSQFWFLIIPLCILRSDITYPTLHHGHPLLLILSTVRIIYEVKCVAHVLVVYPDSLVVLWLYREIPTGTDAPIVGAIHSILILLLQLFLLFLNSLIYLLRTLPVYQALLWIPEVSEILQYIFIIVRISVPGVVLITNKLWRSFVGEN